MKFNLKNGIDIHKLKEGITIFVATRHNVYAMIKKKDRDVTIQGGKYFKDPTEAVFVGSTFGGSVMKIGWIGFGMKMELYVPKYDSTYKTTPVNSAKLTGKDWFYEMEWKENP
jgi:hypothetical protein